MNRSFYAIVGFWQVHFVSDKAERILNFALKRNLPVWGLCREKDGVSFFISSLRYRHLRAFSESLEEGESLAVRRRGLAGLLHLFRYRVGFFAGLAFFALCLYLSGLVVWSVDVSGHTAESEQAVREKLSTLGLWAGAPISSIDTAELSLRLPVEFPEFSYASVNVIGTRAKVEVRHRESLPPAESHEGYVNLVAKYPASIVRYEVLEGTCAVTRAEAVRSGQLLISGIRELKNGSFSPVHARGRVFGETERFFTVSIPLEEKSFSFTGREDAERTLSFLGITLPITGKSRPFEAGEEVLVGCEDAELFGLQLPFTVKTLVRAERIEKTQRITVDRAEKIAYDRYNEYKGDTLAPDYEILSEEISFSYEENAVTLQVTLRVVEDIAVEVPFTFYEK